MLEETKKRLENIQAIEPYLNAMRNTSLGSWKKALNRIQAIHQYRADLIDIFTTVSAASTVESNNPDPSINHKQQIWLVIGSQKGLVSNFNRRLIKLVEKEIEILHTGLRFTLPHVYVLTNKSSYYHKLLSETTFQVDVIPFVYDFTFSDAMKLLDQIPAASDPLKDVFYFYNAYGKSQNSTVMKQSAAKNHPLEPSTTTQAVSQWPPYILDSDASTICEWIQNMFTYLEFQEVLTNSIASENSFRHRILEEAKNNTDRLIHELTIEISMSRKKEITKEIQELAVAAGLIQ